MRRFLVDMLIVAVLTILVFTCIAITPIQAQETLPEPIACWITDGFLAVLHQDSVVYYVAVLGNFAFTLHPGTPMPWSTEALFAMCDPSNPLYPGGSGDSRVSPNGQYLAEFVTYEQPGQGGDTFIYYYLEIRTASGQIISPDFR